MPDLYNVQRKPVLGELKCISPYHPTPLQGQRGAPAACDGHFIAFGCTLEEYGRTVLGHAARGCDTDPWWDRLTGAGRLLARDGQYADALAKGYLTHHLHLESTAAMAPPLLRLLRSASEAAKRPGADSTVYGSGRASHRSFMPHHIAAISSAVVGADSNIVANSAASISHLLAAGFPSPACAAPGAADVLSAAP